MSTKLQKTSSGTVAYLIPSLLLSSFLLILNITGCTSPEKKIALVIGNEKYDQQELKLENTMEDAKHVRAALKLAKFEIFPTNNTQLDNYDLNSMKNTIDAFNEHAENADIAVFYYSGHAMQFNGTNWLLPLDANITKQSDLNDNNAIRLGNVLLTNQHNEKPGRINILILDACRDNPFQDIKGGLAEVSPPPETLVAFAASPGKAAKDNGLYAKVFYNVVSEMDGIRVQRVFDIVRQIVGDVTESQQIPMYYTNISKDVYFISKRHPRFVFTY
ncbi:MAG: caspase family protein [Candidatus Thiodiazotropha taylori]